MNSTALLEWLLKSGHAEAVMEAFDRLEAEFVTKNNALGRMTMENEKLRENTVGMEQHLAQLYQERDASVREKCDEIDVLVDCQRGVNALIENSFRDLGLDPGQGDDTQEALRILLAAWDRFKKQSEHQSGAWVSVMTELHRLLRDLGEDPEAHANLTPAELIAYLAERWQLRLQGRPTVEEWDRLCDEQRALLSETFDQAARIAELKHRASLAESTCNFWEEKVRSGELVQADTLDTVTGAAGDTITELKRELQNTRIALGLAKKRLEDVRKEIHGDAEG